MLPWAKIRVFSHVTLQGEMAWVENYDSLKWFQFPRIIVIINNKKEGIKVDRLLNSTLCLSLSVDLVEVVQSLLIEDNLQKPVLIGDLDFHEPYL